MILYSADAGIARITLNRPEKRNALSEELIAALAETVDRSATDPAIRVVTITGAGKDFCSGADLAGLQSASHAGVLDHMASARRIADLFLALRRHPRPVVALVKGRALAGGCGLASACDLVLASESAQFGYPEVNIGFVPAMVMAILRRSVSEKRSFEMIAMGETFSAAAAREAGLVNQVWPDAEFDQSAEAWIAKLASKPSGAISLSKHLLYHLDAVSFEQALEAGVEVNAIARQTDEFREGVARFLNKGATR